MPLTEEDKAEAEKISLAAFTKAIASEDFQKTIGSAVGASIRKIVPGMVTDSLKPLTDKVTGFETKFTEMDEAEKKRLEDEGEGEKKKPKAGDPDPAIAKQLKDLTTKLDAETKKREKAEKETQTAEEKRRAGLTRSEFTRTAIEQGVDPKMADVAYSHLAASLALAEDGVTVIGKAKNEEGAEETQPLKDFVGGWVKTDVGKRFVTTDATGGTGGKPGSPTKPAGTPVTGKDVLKQMISQGM